MTITAGRSDNRGRKTHGEKQEKKEENKEKEKKKKRKKKKLQTVYYDWSQKTLWLNIIV